MGEVNAGCRLNYSSTEEKKFDNKRCEISNPKLTVDFHKKTASQKCQGPGNFHHGG